MVFPTKARKHSMRKGPDSRACRPPQEQRPKRTKSEGWLRFAVTQSLGPCMEREQETALERQRCN